MCTVYVCGSVMCIVCGMWEVCDVYCVGSHSYLVYGRCKLNDMKIFISQDIHY